MSVTLRKRKNADGSISLRLDIYNNGQRSYELLSHLRLEKPSTPIARENNKDLMKQAEAIRVARAAELEAGGYNLVSDAGKRTVVIVWLKAYAENYKKKDVRNVAGVINRFDEFLREERKLQITFPQLTPALIESFIDFLNHHHKGEGPGSYYARFKRAIKAAYKKRLIKENPLDFVEKKPFGKAAEKEVLIADELKILAGTPIQNPQIRAAALFSAVTGLAWIDVKGLKWHNIDLKNRNIRRYARTKTRESITVALNDTAIKLMGEPGAPNDLVFELPTANGANKTLQAWVDRAKIEKKITWHNLRHSAGTNLALSGTDVLGISKVLAQASVKHAQRYIHAAEQMKRRETDKLNIEL
ncbi:site-specific integrase [Niabella sp.]|uniref:site-specific integrase n=1 Tax=Niabella sp. TaxID=1962976 RepID=UPI0026381B91|nr:site-specific integrase [Niabella sp.]